MLIDTEGREDETQEEFDARWNKYRLVRMRNYTRFGALSGVRTIGPEANGWPDWATTAFHNLAHDDDLHSHTCYPIRKAAKIFAKTAGDSDMELLAKANPLAVFFGLDSERPDLNQIFALIAYDN